MGCRIVRTQGFNDCIETFFSKEDALNWIESNTGIFKAGEYIAIVDFDEFESTFLRMEFKQVPVIIE